MSDDLSHSERELVALGAALGSNCVPCIEYHIPEARRAGLSDGQISAAIQMADKIRQVPARKVLDAATALLDAGAADGGCGERATVPGGSSKPCCG
jgi:4-carboxymuconolactone decarboxylase